MNNGNVVIRVFFKLNILNVFIYKILESKIIIEFPKMYLTGNGYLTNISQLVVLNDQK